MATLKQILNISNKYHIEDDVLDINNCKVTRNGNTEYGTRVTYYKPFSDELKTALKKEKNVITTGEGTYRYAPEIKHGYIILKGILR